MANKRPEVAPNPGGLFDLLLELACQLHVERRRRIALECALEKKGVLGSDWSGACEDSADFRERSASALDRSLAALFRIMEESDDPRRPLRHEAAGFGGMGKASEQENSPHGATLG